MKKLYDAVQRFCARHPRFGIPNLMLYIVAGNAIVYFLMAFTWNTDANALSFLALNTAAVLKGELWRLVTYVFVPSGTGIFWLLISLYFYYWIGTTLERQWGTAKFTLYYVSGVLLTALGVMVASLISGVSYTVSGSYYVNLSMFLAFAFLFPNTQVLLFFVIPIKMKWLAYLDAGLFAVDVVRSLLVGNWGAALLPVIALLNFAVFIWPEVHYMAGRAAYRHSAQTVQFKKAARQQRQQEQQQGYHHKCAVCGRTDTDYPDLQFRYCSMCAGYHSFCQDHIFNHVHFTE